MAANNLPSIMDPPSSTRLSSLCLDESALSDIFRTLYPIAREWENIGTLLCISPDQLSNIGHDYDGAQNCLREMVKLWLKQVTIRPTWQSLACAVSVIDPKIALKISETYKQNF